MLLEDRMQDVEQGVIARDASRAKSSRSFWYGLLLSVPVLLAVCLAVVIARSRPLKRADFPKLNDLQWAAFIDDPAECRRLVGAGTPVDMTDVDGDTALYEAVSSCHIEVVRTLLDLGANPHHLDRFEQSPIMAAERVLDGGRGPGTREQYAAILLLLKRGG